MNAISVLILSRDAEEYVARLQDLPGAELLVAREGEGLPGRAAQALVAFGEPDRVARALPALPAVRWVQSTWAGLTPLLPAATKGIDVTGVKNVFGAQMAEYAIGHLLSHVLELPARREAQAEGRWLDRPTGSLAGGTMGVMGTGSIGEVVARRALGFGLRVIGYSRGGAPRAPFETVYAADRLHAFLERCDYLLAVLPDTPDTRDLLDSAAFSTLPSGALFINVGRGSLVVDEDLVDALAMGHLGGAVLDVFREEPLPAGHPFWNAPRLSLTAHVAARSWPADIAEIFRENFRRFQAGEPLRYRLDAARGY